MTSMELRTGTVTGAEQLGANAKHSTTGRLALCALALDHVLDPTAPPCETATLLSSRCASLDGRSPVIQRFVSS